MIGRTSLVVALNVFLVAAGQARADLQAHWPLDGDLLDEIGGHTATAHGGDVTWPLQFDGDLYLTAPPSHTLDFGGSFSVAAWIRPVSNPPATMCWFGYYESDGRGHAICLRTYTHGKLRFGFFRDDLDTQPGAITFGKWNHVVMQYDAGSDLAEIYVDGERKAFNSAGPYRGGLQTAAIGGWKVPGWPDRQLFHGAVSDVRVYDQALLPADILALVTERAMPIPGDADLDGDVDDDDLSLLLANWTGPLAKGKTWAQGDFEGDGDVACDDVSLVLANWTDTTGTTAMPESTAVGLLGIGTLLLLRNKHPL